jgi:hypothetical protein
MVLKSKNKIKTLLKTSLPGIASLFVVKLTGSITGVLLGINFWTLLCSLVMGIPGVILMLLMKLIW